jgi:excisionase family DNA binding protein
MLLTMPQTAQALGVGRSTVYELIRARRLPAIRIGSVLRVRQQDLTEFVEQLSADTE